jgi:hypothetical protein
MDTARTKEGYEVQFQADGTRHSPKAGTMRKEFVLTFVPRWADMTSADMTSKVINDQTIRKRTKPLGRSLEEQRQPQRIRKEQCRSANLEKAT